MHYRNCLYTLLLLLVLFPLSSVLAEEGSDEVAHAQEEVVQPVTSIKQDLPALIQSKWEEVDRSIRGDNFVEVGLALQELGKLKSQAGFESVEIISLKLLELGSVRYGLGDVDHAAFLLRQSLKLSPTSTKVWFRSIPLATATGEGSMVEHFTAVLSLLSQEPHLMVSTASEVIYPILWALTIGLYLTIIACFVVHIRDYTEAVARKVPQKLRGITGPLLALGLLMLPCLFGPLWAIAGWSVLLFTFLPRYRWVGCTAGAVLALWGFLIPIRENVMLWFQEPGTEVLLRVATGSFLPSDRANLRVLANQNPENGLLHYTLGQLERKYGDIAAAKAAFQKSEEAMGQQPWTKAQLGSISFIEGDAETASKLYQEAEELGLATSAFYFNYSKIEFDLLHTEEARELFQIARSKNPRLVKTLEAREDELGMHSQHTLADIALPSKVLLASALVPIADTKVKEKRLSYELMAGMRSSSISILGLALLALFLLFGGKRKSRLQTYFPDYKHPGLVSATLRLLPGGSWVLSGRSLWGFCIASCSVLLLMPVLRWPVVTSEFLDSLPGAYRIYAGSVALILFMFLFVGTQLEEDV